MVTFPSKIEAANPALPAECMAYRAPPRNGVSVDVICLVMVLLSAPFTDIT